MDCVRSARLLFATLELHIDTDDLEAVRRTIAQIEPGVTVAEKEGGSVPSGTGNLSPPWALLSLGTGFLAFLLIFGVFGVVTGGLSLVGFGLVYLGAGLPVLRKAFSNMVRGRVFDENFLMAAATLAAWAVGAGAEAASVMVFYQWGEFFQQWAVAGSRRSLGALLAARPRSVRVLKGTMVGEARPEDMVAGTDFEVRAGEQIPLDGIVLSGTGLVDSAGLTGEPLPRTVGPGDEVAAGSVNLDGVLRLTSLRPFRDSAWAGIVDSVDRALAEKAPLERFVTRFARGYTPVVLGLALVLFASLTAAGIPWHDSLYRSLVLLVISCPCALVVSIPLTYLGAIGTASKKGLLIRDPGALDRLSRVTVVAFDKTGTLTEGRPLVKRIEPAGDLGRLTAVLNAGFAGSSHPLARIWDSQGPGPEGAWEVRGQGVIFVLEGVRTGVGRRSFLTDQGFPGIPTEEDYDTTVHAAASDGYLGRVDFEDPPKYGVPGVLSDLRNHGIRKIAILSGDVPRIVESRGRDWKVDEAIGGLLPEDKLSRVDRWEKTGDRVLFVGDGMNDAPVLARSTVGVSLGARASAAAIETADVAILDGSPRHVVSLVRLGKRTRTILYQNIGLAIGIKVVFMVLGGMGLAGLWEAVFADVGVALAAVLNSLRAGRSLD